MAGEDRAREDAGSTIEPKGGGRYRIRPSGPFDRQRLQHCFRAMSPESRRLRFFAAKQRLTPAELDLLTSPDGETHIALAAVRLDQAGREREALGFARCLRRPGDPEAELSIAVADAAQGRGIGRALLARLCEAAQDRGIARFRFEVLAENRAMRRLASQLGGEPVWLGDGVLMYECPLPDADPDRGDWGLPWLADTGAWVSACANAWLLQLDQVVTLQQAANDRLGLWLLDACPRSGSGERRAA